MRKLIDRGRRYFALRIGLWIQEVNRRIALRSLPRFGNELKDVEVALPRTLVNPERIFLGEGVRIGPGSLLSAITVYPSSWMRKPGRALREQKFDPKITIGDRVTATAGLQIAAHSEITIEDDVMLASNINITDGLHGYASAREPYKYQGISGISPILIKRGCWLGQNVVVLPGVTIGEFTIVGANSVVTKSLPPQCIAVGSPAKIIKRWDEQGERWVQAGGQHGAESA